MNFSAMNNVVNLQQVLDYRADKTPQKTAISFLSNGEVESEAITFIQLRQRAQNIARQLLQQQDSDQTVLLLFDAGIEFITAFWGCVYAGMIAIPVALPKANRSLDGLAEIVADANANILLSQPLIQQRLRSVFTQHPRLIHLKWLFETPNVDVSASQEALFYKPDHQADKLVFLQYTSGSTGSPKGVMVSHGNLLANEQVMQQVWRNDESSVIVSWLPYFHDMGLIGKVLQAIYSGATLIMMPPIAFIQNPLRWLQAISHYRGTNSGAPNFAYESCLRSISDVQLEQLDLSSWQVAWNGAESVHADTLRRFSRRFAACGFQADVMTPSYGLAEATLIISTANSKSKTPLLALDEEQFKQGKLRVVEQQLLNTSNQQQINTPAHKKWVVGCGLCIAGHQLRIVDPNTRQLCKTDEIGEIWFAGPSVAQGYWRKPEISREIFQAKIEDDIGNNNEYSFLRTGDLGFVNADGYVFIVGRLKDMLIIRGENYAPQDIERSVPHTDPALVADACAAFSVIADGEEKLIVVQEVKRTKRKKLDFQDLLMCIRDVVASEYQLQLFTLILIKQGHLPKTTSGKVQRRLCKTLFLNRQWDALYEWRQGEPDSEQLLEPQQDFQNKHYNEVRTRALKSSKQIVEWLRLWMLENLPVSTGDFDEHTRFAAYGMDSQLTARMTYELEQFVNNELDPTLCWNYPSPRDLADFVVQQLAANDSAVSVGKMV